MRSWLLSLLLGLTAMWPAKLLAADIPVGALDGYKYVFVELPQYEGGVDRVGLGRLLIDKFRSDRTWVVVNDLSADQRASIDQSQVVVVQIEHSWGEMSLTNSVKLVCRDALGAVVVTVDAKSGMGLSVEGDLKKALNKAFERIQKARPRFDPAKVNDLASRFSTTPTFEMDEGALRQYLADNEGVLSPVEGIWTAVEGTYRLGIIRQGAHGRHIGWVLETRNPLWKPGMVKAKLEATATPGLYTAVYYAGDHREVGTTASIEAGVLSVPFTTPDGKQDVAKFIRNFPASGPAAPEEVPGGNSTGTGFAVSRNLLITCHHVIKNAKRIEIAFGAGKEVYPVDVVASDEANDLAMLRVLPDEKGKYPSLTPLVLSDAPSRPGERVFTVGFPLGDLLGEGLKVVDGTLAATEGLQGDPRMLQVSAPIQPGNSGGPLLDDSGRVIGVVVSSLNASYIYKTAGTLPQNVNFAVRSEYIKALSRSNSLAASSALTGLSRPDQVERMQQSVGQVRAFTR